MYLYFADLVPKFQRRVPRTWSESPRWRHWQDALVARHYLAGRRKKALLQQYQSCVTIADYDAFSRSVFVPTHQIADEIFRFLALANEHSPQSVLEIGTAHGGTNFLLGTALPTVRLKIGLDLFVQNTRLLQTFSRTDCRQVFLHASSYAPETVEAVGRILAGKTLDILFIDGDHRYEGARADFDRYLPLVRPGGLIAFHDIVPDSFTRYGRKTLQWAGDIPRLWSELRPQFTESWEFVADPNQDGFGIGVVRKPL